MSLIRTHIYYSGHVQGVGFRYGFERLAIKLDIKGWVKNLSDGRVEATIEGPQDKTDLLLKRVDEHFAGFIKDKNIDQMPTEGTFKDFHIIY